MGQKSKQAEVEQKRRQVLLTVSKVMRDMVALGLEHIVVFVFDLPCCAAVCSARRGRRRARRAHRSAVGASGRGRGTGRTASAPWATARASRGSVVAHGPVACATSLTGMPHHAGPGDRSPGHDHGPGGAARGGEHHARGRCRLALGDEGRQPRLLVRPRPAFARGPQGARKWRFGNLYTNKDLRGRPPHSSRARPCRMRALWRRTTVRALGGKDATTHATPQSRRPRR